MAGRDHHDKVIDVVLAEGSRLDAVEFKEDCRGEPAQTLAPIDELPSTTSDANSRMIVVSGTTCTTLGLRRGPAERSQRLPDADSPPLGLWALPARSRAARQSVPDANDARQERRCHYRRVEFAGEALQQLVCVGVDPGAGAPQRSWSEPRSSCERVVSATGLEVDHDAGSYVPEGALFVIGP